MYRKLLGFPEPGDLEYDERADRLVLVMFIGVLILVTISFIFIRT